MCGMRRIFPGPFAQIALLKNQQLRALRLAQAGPGERDPFCPVRSRGRGSPRESICRNASQSLREARTRAFGSTAGESGPPHRKATQRPPVSLVGLATVSGEEGRTGSARGGAVPAFWLSSLRPLPPEAPGPGLPLAADR